MSLKFTKERMVEVVELSKSIADICRMLNIKPVGGNYKTINKYIKQYDIDTSHFTGQGWNSGDDYQFFGIKYELKDILVENSTYTSTYSLKKRLLKEGLKENICEICNIKEWNGKLINMHLDHINGNNIDNRIENLRMLCPNCHSQTETYCGGNIKKNIKVENINKCECGIEIKKESKMCNKCHTKSLRKVERPSIEQLKIDIKELGYAGTGRKYGVSDNAIRKWIK